MSSGRRVKMGCGAERDAERKVEARARARAKAKANTRAPGGVISQHVLPATREAHDGRREALREGGPFVVEGEREEQKGEREKRSGCQGALGVTQRAANLDLGLTAREENRPGASDRAA